MDFNIAGEIILDSAEFNRVYLQQCRKEGLTPAIIHLKTGEIFTGDNHRDCYSKRREKLPDEGASLGATAELGTERRYKRGFVDEDGEFHTNDEIEKRFGFRYSEAIKEYPVR